MFASRAAALLLAFACAASWPQGPSRRGGPTERAPLPVTVIESPGDAADRQARQSRADQQEAESLDARIRSATAAEKLVVVGAGSLALALLGVLALIWTFIATRRSAQAAMRAAMAAESSMKLAQQTMQRQLRAYLTVDAASIRFPRPGVPRVRVTIRNSGQTPAYEVKHWIHQGIETHSLEIELTEPRDDFGMAVHVMGPGTTATNEVTHDGPIIDNPSDAAVTGRPEGTFYVYGQVTYRDVFGAAHSTKYRLMHGGPDPARRGRLVPCPEGNEAT